MNKPTITIVNRQNSEIFEKMASEKIVKPEVPQFYVEQSDIWIPNPNHPTYIQAMQVYMHEKSVKAQDAAVLLSTKMDEEIVGKLKTQAKYKIRKVSDENIWLDFLYANYSQSEIIDFVNRSFLTENKIYDIFSVLVSSIYRNGVEITNARIKNAINSQIQLENITIFGLELVHPLDEYTACIESNLNWIEWPSFNNSKKAEIVALYRIKKIVENHSQDEAAIEMERKNK